MQVWQTIVYSYIRCPFPIHRRGIYSLWANSLTAYNTVQLEIFEESNFVEGPSAKILLSNFADGHSRIENMRLGFYFTDLIGSLENDHNITMVRDQNVKAYLMTILLCMHAAGYYYT